jgi:hypothetical protein
LTRSFIGGEPTIRQRPFEPFDLEQPRRTTPSPKPQTPTPEPKTETETSEGSFDTVPEISEPVERLFDTIFRNRNQPKPLIKRTKLETPVMDVEPRTEPTNGIRAGRIVPFSGKRNEVRKFLDSLKLHFILNKIRTDEDKVVFALTYLEGGDAESWKEAFINSAQTDGTISFGTWANFEKALREDFKPYDAKGDAMDEIIKLRQGNNSIEDHVAKFKILLANTGVDDDSPSALDYFQRSIRVPLLKKIMDLPDPPTKLTKWYEWALKFDANYHRLMRLLNRDTPKKEEKTTKPRWNFRRTEKDPNAMDIDTITKVYGTMTPEERTELMRKGCCFRCKKPRHLSRDCPEKKGKTSIPNSSTTPSTAGPSTPKKMTAKELTAHIRSLTALLDDEEKGEFYDEAEKEGF